MLLASDVPDVLKVAEYVKLGTIEVDEKNAGMNGDYDILLIVRLLCKASLSVLGNTEDSDAVVRNVILTALSDTAPSQLQVIGYDPTLKTPEAPFMELNNALGDSVVNLQSGRELDELLVSLTDDVSRISTLLRGSDATLAQYRAECGMPVERYRLVVMHEYPQYVSEEQHQRIMHLVQRGAQFGITFLFDMGAEDKFPDWFDRDAFAKAVNSFAVGQRDVWSVMPDVNVAFDRLSKDDAIRAVDTLASNASAVSIPKVPFDSIQPSHNWGMASEDGVTFAIGRDGNSTMEITLGSEREQKHNALITGAVGQGKSNLLKVIIYSLCSRYSPDELNLYLLDFKEGVTLYPMAPTSDSPEYLPHARVLGLQADQDFGVSVLKYLEQEFVRRARLFKPYGDNILKYRKANPDKKMPRIVLIIDEFHMMLENESGSKTGSKAADLLERIVRRGRSYGVHVILASQSISGIATLLTSSQGVFSQFPIRIGLKNSPREAQATFTTGNDASAHLQYRGQAIVNAEYGNADANRTVMVAAADDKELDDLRDEWYVKEKDEQPAPVVFDGSKASNLLADIDQLDQLGLREMVALFGHPVRVDQKPMTMKLNDAPGRNAAILGTGVAPDALPDDEDNNMGIGVIEAAGISIAMQRQDEGSAVFVVLDLLGDADREANHVDDWLDTMVRSGLPIQVVHRHEFFDWLTASVKELGTRKPSDPPVYVLGLGLDRAGAFDRNQEKAFQTLLSQGPIADVHVIGWWSNVVAFTKQMGLARASAFDTSMLLFGAQDAVKMIHGPLVEWKGQENRGFYYDVESGQEVVKVIPYMPLGPDQLALLWEED